MPRSRADRFGQVNEVLAERRKYARKSSDVKIWENRLRLSEQKAEPYWREYMRNEDFYVGKQLGTGNWEDDWALDQLSAMMGAGRTLVVNRIMATLAATNAGLMWKLPHFYLWARKPSGLMGEESLRSAEAVINYVLHNPKNNLLLNARMMLLSTEMNFGVLKATYTPDEGLVPGLEEEDEFGELVVDIGPGGDVFIDFVGGQPVLDDNGLPVEGKNGKFLVDNRQPADWFRSQWIHYMDMRIDPEGCNDTNDHGWIGQRMNWTYDEYMKNLLLGEKDKIQEVATFLDKEGLSRRTRSRLSSKENLGGIRGIDPTMPDKDLMRIWGYQCWDMRRQELVYLVDGLEKPVAKIGYPKGIDNHPYSFSKFHEVPGDFYPLSEVTAVRPLAQAYNEMQSMLLTHARRYGRKYLMRKGALNPREREKFKDPDDGVVIELERGDPNNAVAPVKDAPLDVAIYRNIERYIQDFSEIMGSSPEARQVSDSDTATQAAIIERHSTTRDNDKRAMVAHALEGHARKMLNLLQAHLDVPMALQIQGPDGQAFKSRKLSKAQIAGDFETRIDLGELEPHDVRTEKQDSLALLQILGPQFAFQSPTFTRRFFQVWRWDDPQMAKEFQQIAQGMMQAEQGTPDQGGGPKPTAQGPEGDTTSEGRSEGRQAREQNKAPRPQQFQGPRNGGK